VLRRPYYPRWNLPSTVVTALIAGHNMGAKMNKVV
jgi:hypothetical protein